MERYIHTNFTMMLVGLLVYFTFTYSIGKNKKKWANLREFKADQIDEIAVCFIGGMAFVIFDGQILNALHDVLGWAGRMFEMGLLKDLPEFSLQEHYYLLVGPAVKGLYFLIEKIT